MGQIKGDVGAAEEYYARAILADQEDGETLSQYAKIIWEVHHDRDRAANYFQRALEASSQNRYLSIYLRIHTKTMLLLVELTTTL